VRGLDKTGKREQWGFKGWPLLDIEPKTPEAVVFGGKRDFGFKVEVALVNENKKVIAKSSINLNAGKMTYSAGDSLIKPPAGDANLVRFPKVNANDLTPSITIVITGVNGINSKKLSESGYIKIAAGDLEEKMRAIEEGRTRAIEEEKKAAAAVNMVPVPAGTFQMGSNNGDRDEKPIHQVTISKPFYMGKYEVTQKEWVEVMGSNPSYFKGDNLPVENVSWYGVIDYCNKRSVKEGLTPAYTVSGSTVTWNKNANGYRLPTEAEWEWAAKGGGKDSTITEYSGSNSADGVAWYSSNSGGKTHPVGTKSPNSLGIYDMSGNVWEWCWDWSGSYSSGAQTDPAGASSGSDRVARGGSWLNYAEFVHSASRSGNAPANRGNGLGCRLVRPSLPPSSS
jgi:formylglycine-generating enzyme required for sulfatase activity